jgi:hypothetical protein
METSRMKIHDRFIALLAGVLIFAALPASAQETNPKARLQTAEKMFAERCKKAGEFIHRTAENVEGVFLMKIRPKGINYGDQYRMDDPYGRDLDGDGYIKNFLQGYETRQAQFVPGSPTRYGYHYVEAIDPTDGKRYRYTGSIKEVTKTSSPLVGGDGSTFKVKDFTLDRVPARSAITGLPAVP